MNKQLLKIIAILFLICSCKEGNVKRNENTHEVLSTLYDRLSVQISTPFPPLKKGITKKDSLEIVQKYKRYKKKQENRKFIVAIDPTLSPVKNIEINKEELNKELKELLLKLNSFKKDKSLDIPEIAIKKKDSIIEFNDDLIEKNRCDYLKFDKLINFSRIAFNEDKTIAAVIGSVSTNCLAGHSSLYFLEKRNDHWAITKIIELSIS